MLFAHASILLDQELLHLELGIRGIRDGRFPEVETTSDDHMRLGKMPSSVLHIFKEK